MMRRLLAGLLLVGLSAPLRADPRPFLPPQTNRTTALPQTPQVPMESLTPDVREKVRYVLERPSLSSKGLPETFNADIKLYHWLLDHPDVNVKLWRAQGSKVADIEKRGPMYYWTDNQGSEIFWYTAARVRGTHVWYAEGKVKAGALLPASAVRAVVVLHHVEGKDLDGKPAIQQQVHFMVRCDSRAIALATKIFGASAPKMIEQYLGQLQMFYAGMAWYLSQDEQRAKKLYLQVGLTLPAETAPVSSAIQPGPRKVLSGGS